MVIRYIKFSKQQRDLSPDRNIGVTSHRPLIDRFFKELVPERLAGEPGSFDYSMMSAFVKEYSLKSHLRVEQDSVVYTNYGKLERAIKLLGRPEVMVVAGDIGSGKTTSLRATKYFLETLKPEVFIAYIHLRLRKLSNPTIEELLEEIKVDLVERLERDVPEFLKRCGKFPSEPLLHHIFKEALEALGATKDGVVLSQPLVDEYLMSLSRHRKGREFAEFCRGHFAFLHRTGYRSIVILDDVDMLDNQTLARSLVDHAQGSIASPLGVPVIVSVRHETLMKFRDAGRPVPKRDIIRSVDPRLVLTKRVGEFQKWAKDDDLTNNNPMPDDQLAFVTRRASEFVEGVIIDKLAKMNPSCEFVLDVFRTVVMSPLIRKEQPLTWNRVFNTLMLYVWDYMDAIGSFIINMFDNDGSDIPGGHEYKNALLRVRLTQCIIKKCRGLYDQPIMVSDVLGCLANCGYEDETALAYALLQFARRRLILTPVENNEFDLARVSQIYMHKSLDFYLDELILDYLYLENIIPVTAVDVVIDMSPYAKSPTLDFGPTEFKIMDENIYNFIRFIEKCETQEENACRAVYRRSHKIESIAPLVDIRGEKQLSILMKEALWKQIGDGERAFSRLVLQGKKIPYPEIKV